MSILSECTIYKRKQSLKNKLCRCGEDLDKAKRSRKVRYWINYRLPGGKQRREFVGYSITEARDAEGKRRSQKRENRVLDILPKPKITFYELAKWYLNLERVKALASYDIIKINLNKFNSTFGDMVVSRIKPVDLENYQTKRLKQGRAPATVDHEIGKAKTMINKACENKIVGFETRETFRIVKKTLKRGSDVRDRILSSDEFKAFMKNSEGHTRAIPVCVKVRS